MTDSQYIIQQVLSAQTDSRAADDFIRQYMPFIRSEAAKTVKHSLSEEDEEMSIAMLAFYEAIGAYAPHRGPFLPFAARAIRHRLIDHHRKESRHAHVLSYHAPAADGETELLHSLSDPSDPISDVTMRQAAQTEIAEFSTQLESLGLCLSDVADNCPKQDRTLYACLKVLSCAKKDAVLLERTVKSGKLPIAELSGRSGVDKKTIERHRKYLMALLLAYTNGFEIIRGHLYQMEKREGKAE